MDVKPLIPIFSFVDLDDTLLQARHRRDPGLEGRLVAEHPMRIHAGWQCVKQQSLTAMLFSAGTVIPCTARSTRSIDQVDLGQPFTSWRIASGGAVILRPDGTEDEVWRVRAVRHMDEAAVDLDRLLDRFKDERFPGRMLLDRERPIAVRFRVETREDRTPLAERVQRWLEATTVVKGKLSVEIHQRNQTLTVRPFGAGKGDAVRYLLDTHLPFERLVLGFGDAPEDQGFLAHCDYAAHPNLNPYTRDP